jgi:hypothetical protein
MAASSSALRAWRRVIVVSVVGMVGVVDQGWRCGGVRLVGCVLRVV